MNKNLERLMARLPDGVDAAIITSPVNRRYYTGLKSSAGTLLVTRERACLVIDFRYIEAARRGADGFEVRLQEKLGEQLRALCREQGVGAVAVESRHATVASLLDLRGWLGDIHIPMDNALSDLIGKQRAVKSEEEYRKMQRAQDIADRCFAELLNFIRPGLTEREVANELATLMRRYGAEGESFETIAASGKNSALPHGRASDKVIERGDLFTLDFGVVLDGWCSDMTRTVGIGALSDEKRRVYETVLAAQRAALAAIAPGAPCKTVDAAARDLIEAAGYKGCFGHGLGHGLGLEVHEEPRFSPTDDALVEPGLVMSVEPGIYLEGQFGCRIEDVIYVGETGVVNLTHSPKELNIL